MKKSYFLYLCLLSVTAFSCQGKEDASKLLPVNLPSVSHLSSLCQPLEEDVTVVPVTDGGYIAAMCDCEVDQYTLFAADKDSSLFLMRDLLTSQAFDKNPLFVIQTDYGDTLTFDFAGTIPTIISDTLTAERVVAASGDYLEYNVVYLSMRKDGSLLMNGFETFTERLSEELDLLQEVYFDRKTIIFINIDLHSKVYYYIDLRNAIALYFDKIAIGKYGAEYANLTASQKEEFKDILELSRTEYFYDSDIIGDDCGCTKESSQNIFDEE